MIPTIEEFEKMHMGRYNSYYELAVAFAVAHCEAQAYAISEKITLTEFAQEFLQEGADDAIDKNSIINAYPLTNIK